METDEDDRKDHRYEPINEIFPQPQYGMPDGESLELSKYLVEDKPFIYKDGHDGDDKAIVEGDIPPDMLNFFWGFLSKDQVLTYIDEKDVALARIRFKKAKMAFILSIPREDFTYETMRHLNNLENKFISRVKRGLLGFERKQQRTTTGVSLYGQMDEQQMGRRNYGPLGLGRIFGGGIR